MKNLNVLCLLVLASCSGMAGIAYEIIYVRTITSFVFGEVNYVVYAILIGIFSGLATGAYLSENLYRYIWIVELILGCFAILIAYLTNSLELQLVYWVPSSLFGTVFFSFILCFFPFFLIGMAVPSFALLLEKHNNMNNAFVSIYSIYNVFAAFSILITEFWLIRRFGLNNSMILFGIWNIAVGTALFFIIKNLKIPKIALNPIKSTLLYKNRLYGSAIILGIIGSMWQLLYLDFSFHVFGAFQETISLVFFSAIFGIGIGGFIARWVKFNQLILYAVIAGLLTFLALTDMWLYAFSHNFGLSNQWIVSLLAVVRIQESADFLSQYSLNEKWNNVLIARQIATVVFGLPIFCLIGMFVPYIVQRGNKNIHYGTALATVSVGNVLGIFVYSTVGRQLLTTPLTVLLLLLLTSIVIFYSANNQQLWKRIGVLLIPIAMAIPLIFYFPLNLLSSGHSAFVYPEVYANFKSQISQKKILYSDFSSTEGKNYVLEDKSVKAKSLVHLGYRVFGLSSMSHLVNRETSHAAIAAIYAKENKNAYLIGLGSGITAMGVNQFFENTTIVDINPAMQDIAGIAFAEYNDDVLNQPNVKMITQDAVVDIVRTNKKYDAIINTASSPLYFSTNKIYTSDFFRIVSKKLNQGGVYTGWLDKRMSSTGIMIARNTLLSVFDQCEFFALTPDYYIFTCGNHQLKMKEIVDYKQRFDTKIFESIHIPDEAFYPSHKINTLDRPLLSYANWYYQSQYTYEFSDAILNLVYNSKNHETDICENDVDNNRAVNLFLEICDPAFGHGTTVSHDELHLNKHPHLHEDSPDIPLNHSHEAEINNQQPHDHSHGELDHNHDHDHEHY